MVAMEKPNKEINKFNCRLLLAAFMEKNGVGSPSTSKAIGCSHATFARILAGITFPSIEFMKQVGILLEIGINNYEKLSEADKEKISEAIGTIGGGALGFAGIASAVSAAGVAGLSAAGITSGLAA